MQTNRRVLLAVDLPPTGAVDPFDVPSGELPEPTFPLLRPSLYDLRITKGEVGPSKSTPGNEVLLVTLVTTQPEVSTKDETIPAGLPLYYRIGITPTEKMNAQRVAENIGQLAKAAGLPATVTPRQIINDPSLLRDKIVRCKVKVQKETPEFPESNAIAQVLVVK